MLQRIRHFRAGRATDIIGLLQGQLQLEPERVAFLLDIGAIYCNEIRIHQNQALSANDILRVHLEPKRFPTENFNPQKDTLFEHADFLILSKPAGLPSGPSLDNQKENLLSLCEKFYGQKLWLPHRLDIGTSGLICLARNKAFATWIAGQLESRKVEKIYECEVQGLTPQLGTLVHWMRKSNRSPKIISREEVKSWLYCELEILQIRKIKEKNFRLTIKLDTGRTHQIRAQLSFEGYPILNDGLYTHGKAEQIESFRLACKKLSFQYQGKLFSFDQTPNF